MQAKTIIAALAGTALASDLDQLVPRQTQGLGGCLAVISSIPTPPPALASALVAADAISNLCAVTVAPSLSSDFSSYSTAVESWLKSNEKSLSNCPFPTQIVSGSLNCKSATATPTRTTGSTTGAAAHEGPVLVVTAAMAVAVAGFVVVAL